MSEFDRQVFDTLEPLVEAGFALHWLLPKSKRPVDEGWSRASRATLAGLTAAHQPKYNLGVRLGNPSELSCGGYLHAIDLDIRIDELTDEATTQLGKLLRGVDLSTLPIVISGSGGKSRHIYFVTDRPFYSKKLSVSEGKHRGADGKWHYDWEIELFGTGKQVVLPPSIHPDTGKPYAWLREFDFGLLELGIAPEIPAETLERITEAQSETYAFESRPPLEFKPGQLEGDLAAIPDGKIDDYHDWVMLGQALHHQFGAGDEGYDLWIEVSKRSSKFSERGMRSKWRGFGRNRRQPVTMGTIRAWAIEARQEAMIADFEDFDDAFEGGDQSEKNQAVSRENAGVESGDLDIDSMLGETDETDLLGGASDGQGEPGAGEKKPELHWLSLLHINPETQDIKATLHNISLMVRNDPRIANVPQVNEFTQEVVQRVAPGKKSQRKKAAKPTKQLDGRVWQVTDPVNGTLWSDTHDSALRDAFEAPKSQGGYGIKISDRDLHASIDTAASENRFHPVREYLSALKWDRAPRVEQMFVSYLGAPDDAYTRAVARLVLVAAVARVFEPGHKFDYAVILEGLQGKRKSTFINKLGKSWSAELDGDFHNHKEMVELMQGSWIMEIPELSGFNKTDVRALKAFISRQVDKTRLAYAKRAQAYARQCVFIGSTNDREYLKDDTGGRRFWPMLCQVDSIDIERLEGNVDQLWAEAYVMYRAMRKQKPVGDLPLYLVDPLALEIAESLQETRRVEGAEEALGGAILDWLEQPVLSGDGFENEAPEPRLRTCLVEIAVEGLGYTLKDYQRDRALAFQIGRAMGAMPGWRRVEDKATSRRYFEKWGRQRTYERVISTK